jgi:TPR repeat protein
MDRGKRFANIVGVLAGALWLGRGPLYDTGIGLQEHHPVAAARLQNALCALRMSQACFALGLLYRNGTGVEQDLSRAEQLYRSSCDDGVYEGCNNLGVLYDQGLGRPVDLQRALTYFARACGEAPTPVHDRLGCNNAAIVSLRLHDDEANTRYRQRGCDAGDLEACMYLARNYYGGAGVPRDYAAAMGLSRRACAGGQSEACFDLGVAVQEGLGRSVDLAEARQLFRQACEGGSPKGCANLGFYAGEGTGGPADPDAAIKAWQKACEGGEERGCVMLASTVSQEGVAEAVRSAAVAVMKRGCDAGVGAGCIGLGMVTLVDDRGRALELFIDACDHGMASGCARFMSAAGQQVATESARLHAALDKMAVDDVDDPAVLTVRASLWRSEGHDVEAISDLDRVLELQPGDAAALNNRAWSKVRTADFAGARADAELAVEKKRDPARLGTLCWALAGLGDVRAALAACREALKGNRDEPLDRGMVAFLEKRPKDARREWQRALERAPADGPAVAHWLKLK